MSNGCAFIVVLLYTPFLMVSLCCLYVLSLLERKPRFTNMYVGFLLKIFEYGRVDVNQVEESNQSCGSDDEESDDFASCFEDEGSSTSSPDGDWGFQPPEENESLLVNENDEWLLQPPSAEEIEKAQEQEKKQKLIEKFDLSIICDFSKAGFKVIVEDQVTSRFQTEELKNWNFLTRTNRGYEFISWKLTIMWIFGFCTRYFFMFPIRVLICLLGLCWFIFYTTFLDLLKDGDFKQSFKKFMSHWVFFIFSKSIATLVTYHQQENKPLSGICVANHTSPIDALILLCDNNIYSLVGQKHGGILGYFQKALSKAEPHIWFERIQASDRRAVAARIREHVSDRKNPPLLIFPEGTCINNTSVMQFKKGSFDVDSVIYPVAIKYDPRFGDAFWNSHKHSMLSYLFMLMTSWAVVCDVWYLPPMTKDDVETPEDFASRVKSRIAKKGGMADLAWDGALKRIKAKTEWKEMQQMEFSKKFKIGSKIL